MKDVTGFSTGSELNENLAVKALDEVGPGGAHHEYAILVTTDKDGNGYTETLKFQKGPLKEAGVNGISDEVLLAIIIDRAEGFADGPYNCQENDLALYHLKEALKWKKNRTMQRQARGVEGTMAK